MPILVQREAYPPILVQREAYPPLSALAFILQCRSCTALWRVCVLPLTCKLAWGVTGCAGQGSASPAKASTVADVGGKISSKANKSPVKPNVGHKNGENDGRGKSAAKSPPKQTRTYRNLRSLKPRPPAKPRMTRRVQVCLRMLGCAVCLRMLC